MSKNKSHLHFEPGLIIALLMLLLFATPVTILWINSGAPWFVPYLAWLFVIVLTYWQAHRK